MRTKKILDRLQLISFFVIYTLITIVPIYVVSFGGGDILTTMGWIGAGLGIYIMIFLIVQQYTFRKIAEMYFGTKIMEGWLDEEEDMGEEYEFIVSKITTVNKLSTGEKEAYDEFMRQELSRSDLFSPLRLEDLIKKPQNKLDWKKKAIEVDHNDK